MITKLKVIEIFKEPVKRSELPIIFGCGDREARKILAHLREKYNIINLSDGKGYILADDETALRYAFQERKRAISVFKNASRIIARCTPSQGGREVLVRSHYRRLNKNTVIKDQISLEDI